VAASGEPDLLRKRALIAKRGLAKIRTQIGVHADHDGLIRQLETSNVGNAYTHIVVQKRNGVTRSRRECGPVQTVPICTRMQSWLMNFDGDLVEVDDLRFDEHLTSLDVF
jgi:hypothetical protein